MAKRYGLWLLIVLLSMSTAFAESRWTKPLRWSWAALAVSTVSDTASSYGHSEANPWLASRDQRFSGRGVALKAAVIGGIIAGEYLLHRRLPNSEPAHKTAAVINFAAAGVTAGQAIRNWRMD